MWWWTKVSGDATRRPLQFVQPPGVNGRVGECQVLEKDSPVAVVLSFHQEGDGFEFVLPTEVLVVSGEAVAIGVERRPFEEGGGERCTDFSFQAARFLGALSHRALRAVQPPGGEAA